LLLINDNIVCKFQIKGEKMKKFTISIVLQMIFLSSVMASNGKIYKALCLSEAQKYDIKMIEQKDGYQVVEYKKIKYILIIDSDMVMPKNNCDKGRIPLFVQ